jgi:hypothetical protein
MLLIFSGLADRMSSRHACTDLGRDRSTAESFEIAV